MGVLVNELNNNLRRNIGRDNMDLHFLRSFRGVRMSDEYVKAVFNKLIIELDEALLKAKASLDYHEDKKLIDDAWKKTMEVINE
tara:strand:- start:90 stop:341 length:252 start_codon:yes stop_codon:yes gene_type:complete